MNDYIDNEIEYRLRVELFTGKGSDYFITTDVQNFETLEKACVAYGHIVETYVQADFTNDLTISPLQTVYITVSKCKGGATFGRLLTYKGTK